MRVIDTHTEGEPTRVILEGGPELGQGTVAQLAQRLAVQHPDFYTATLLEPRGHDAMVGALLVPTSLEDCCTGVIFYNPVGNLGMCGHATLGTAVALAHTGQLQPGTHRFETPVGVVEVELHGPNTASVRNIESYRYKKSVSLSVPEVGDISGDIAWGGNWFFLVKESPLPLEFDRIDDLTRVALRIKNALKQQGITGKDGAEIDHVELFGPAQAANANSRNFVLCPGGAYDRSPCGTGCSAKLACLAADALLAPETVWIQESIISSTYTLSYIPGDQGGIIPTITGTAYVTALNELIFHAEDPYRCGITAV
ncbi:proline racemase family protein [Nitrincola sp.]|uniref:4-hydroxyproline epimerase n=1 Tax=Nitrincola sp. TaxID=1926584 RepID=UPI003A8E4112